MLELSDNREIDVEIHFLGMLTKFSQNNIFYTGTWITCGYKDHPRDQKICGPCIQVVFICRFNSMESIRLGTCNMRSIKQVAFGAGFTLCV